MVHMSGIALPPGWWERLEALGGRRRDTIVVGALVGSLVFGGLALRARGEPASIAPPARATPSPGPSAPGALVVVHVAGAVRHPGIIELPAGSRVADAIELAGGALRGATLDALNLAALVVDGTQILVPSGSGNALTSIAGTSPVPSSTQSNLVDLNAADQATLETVPGLGPVKAGAILAYRTEIGSFTSIDQLLEVSGIGPATLESIKPFVTL